MNQKRKEFLRREMLGCAKIARGCTKFGRTNEAALWNETAARRLFELGGMLANW